MDLDPTDWASIGKALTSGPLEFPIPCLGIFMNFGLEKSANGLGWIFPGPEKETRAPH